MKHSPMQLFQNLCHRTGGLYWRSYCHLSVKIKVGLSWAKIDELGQEHVWRAYIPIFSSIGAKEPPSQWGSSFEPFYLLKSWFLAIFRRNFKALLVGLESSGVSHMNTWPVNCFQKKILHCEKFLKLLRFWATAHFLKSQNWVMQIWYLIIGAS